MFQSADFFSKYNGDETVQKEHTITAGNEIKLNSNFYDLSINEDYLQLLKQYKVQFSPNIQNPYTAREVLFLSICDSSEKQRKGSKTWDSLIFAGLTKIISKETYSPRNVTYGGREYTVSISDGEPVDDDTIKQYLEKVLRKAISKTEKYNKIEREFISKTPYKTIQSVTLYDRFFVSVFHENHKFSLFADSNLMTCRINNGLKEIFKQIWTTDKDANENRDRIENMIISIPFMTNFGTKHIISISKILWDQPRTIMYYGEETTIPKLYMQQYGIPISESEPCALVTKQVNEQKEEESIPIGCLDRIGLTHAEQGNAKFMSDYKRAATQQVGEIINKINAFVQIIKNSPVLSKFHVTLGDVQKMTGTVLAPPSLRFRATQQDKRPVEFIDIQIGSKCSFANDVFKKYHAALGPIFKTSPVIFCTKNADKKSQDLKQNLQSIAQSMGIPMLPCDVFHTEGDSQQQFKIAIAKYIQNYGVPSFVIVVLPTPLPDFYKQIKTFLTCKLGLPSQFVNESTLGLGRNELKTLYQSLMLNVLAKTSGVPFYLSPQSLPLRSTVFVGIAKNNITCSIVISSDSTYARYHSASCRTENAASFFLSKLEQIQASRIVIFTAIKPLEAKELAIAFSQKISNITMISCMRERIILTTDTEKPAACTPGTCVIHNGVLLISSVGNGPASARPTSYIIVHQSPHVWNDDQLATIIQYLCVSYPISVDSMSMPTPVVFANKAAEFNQNVLNSTPVNELLVNHPYYL